ncbi:MAG: hypothetical protein A2887_01670 [Alphaproteobacteria bacterium RIFCSPLOWO2_01_FULL_40_26]|nr:MAG: hypothetical protein A3D15_01635 [Alphaproteobacteria bacterium RIFCSPHIGHO2_02_FULL_40_34]OFW86292.1 MAG: hypothetical protein A2794_02035 [Alphaproteobacteria bacterium RIFCSPHIGHO2_01_FULL_40_8]OFW94988.1 MAG: hypothetical protein A2887_01670 [Alphaproteobacteria bacterium RIFCSPLOWO2_01_FULL_40_26]OFX10564.1 MAG: hypothetical protein A3H30_02520 [Alphaproteobacteria bacterium RIFCSPLOWO2_02_FULL_40_19]OFX12071.1 MAG: hypothetical protein A3G22_03000 [Alphaproteobacteria bacterium RI
MRIRKAQKTDAKKIFELHLKAAEIKDGVARMPKEIFLHDIEDFVDEALQKGLIFVGEIDEKIIAEIHCYKNFPHCFKHCLSNTTLVVHPDFHKLGLGRKIFSHLLEEIKNHHHNIARVELFCRQSNSHAIKLYQSLGFEIEGICKNRLLDSKNELSDDTMMAWFNPEFLQK